jgi:hypothetical protein
LRRVDSALAASDLNRVPFEMRPYAGLANFYALAGRPARARSILARHDAEIPDGNVRRERESSRRGVIATIAMAEGRTREAIREMWSTDTTYDGPDGACRICIYQPIGMIWYLGAVPDSAIHYWEAFLAAPYLGRESMDAVARPFIHRRLGELHEQQGSRGRAAQHYLAVVDLWRDADAELQPKVAELRRRAAQLGATAGR